MSTPRFVRFLERCLAASERARYEPTTPESRDPDSDEYWSSTRRHDARIVALDRQDYFRDALRIARSELDSAGKPGPFYVSVVDGDRHALLAGPFATHREALDRVPDVRRTTIDQHPMAAFAAFGTCRVEV